MQTVLVSQGPRMNDNEDCSNLYMAFGCQEKTSPIDRKEGRDIIRLKVNEALTNDPMVRAWVFRRECQYAKTRLHQTSIEID